MSWGWRIRRNLILTDGLRWECRHAPATALPPKRRARAVIIGSSLVPLSTAAGEATPAAALVAEKARRAFTLNGSRSRQRSFAI
jgi:hypothetical protein